MKIISEDQHRGLAFINQLNEAGYRPTQDEVERWLASPLPRQPKVISTLDFSVLTRFLQATVTQTKVVGEEESVTDHFLRLGWAEHSAVNSSGLVLSPLGRGLLYAADIEPAAPNEVQSVVLAAKSPLSWPRLIGALATAGSGTLVDPYMEVEGLHYVVQQTTITRVLMSKQRKNSAEVRAMISTYLSAPQPRTIEVRASADADLHDRYILSDSGKVTQIGSSINSVARGTSTTLLIDLSGPATAAVRTQLAEWWKAAEPVCPLPPLSADADAAAVP